MFDILRSSVLSLVAFVLALLLCEGGMRVIDGLPLRAIRIPTAKYQPGAMRSLDPTVGGGTLSPDIDPTWINVAPPVRQRPPADPTFSALAQEAVRLGARPFEVYRIWNRRFVEANGCGPGVRLSRLPQPLLVFDPPEPTHFPPFRYPPSTMVMGGMWTNSFGWRGPEIPLNPPADTVRVAFVGASTTVGLYPLPFSYPEYVAHWLNLWAERAGRSVRFDIINAGREGISSGPIAAIIRQEVLPAQPDLIVYYEGANQSLCARGIKPAPPERSAVWTLLEEALRPASPYSQLIRRLQAAVLRFKAHGGYEPDKPPSDARWPVGLDEQHPDITSADLPARFKLILDDLESARVPVEAAGAALALSSFVWLAAEGLQLDPVKHLPIYTDLNTNCWPYRYAEIRRSVDLHNRVLQQYAAAHRLPFLRVAESFPLDPSFFFDSVHLNADGTRLHAWLVFRELLPLVRERLESRAWPRSDRLPLAQHPSIGPGEPYTLHCPDPPHAKPDVVSHR